MNKIPRVLKLKHNITKEKIKENLIPLIEQYLNEVNDCLKENRKDDYYSMKRYSEELINEIKMGLKNDILYL